MSRVPKYQAWDRQEKRMIAVPRLSFGDDGSSRTVIIELPSREGHYRILVVGENAALRAFTGMVDRAGKEVYEGDIVYNPDYDEKGVVTWVTTGLCAFLIMKPDKMTVFGLHNAWEVIGNIYEHPEMAR